MTLPDGHVLDTPCPESGALLPAGTYSPAVDDGFFMNPGSDVSVLLGQGHGTFATEQRFPVGQGPVAVAVADLNGDTIPDLEDHGGAHHDARGIERPVVGLLPLLSVREQSW